MVLFYLGLSDQMWHLSDLKETREQNLWISGRRKFQAEGIASANGLGWELFDMFQEEQGAQCGWSRASAQDSGRK